MNRGEFIAPVFGRKRKLLFDSESLMLWIKAQQPPPESNAPTVRIVKQVDRDKDKTRRLEAARATLNKHQKKYVSKKLGTKIGLIVH
jgi:hypothetical protein